MSLPMRGVRPRFKKEHNVNVAGLPNAHRIRVWDLPTRLFHWSLLACVLALAVTGTLGGQWMNWHFRLGHAVLALLLWRIVWGLVGGRWSRFASFVYRPSSVLAYLRGQAPLAHQVGHSPMGALSVFALLTVLLVQVGSGLSSDDEIAFVGPLAQFVSGEWVRWATYYHKNWGKWILLGLVVLHLLAVAYYTWVRRARIVAAMVHGDKWMPQAMQSSQDDVRQRSWAGLLLLVCALASWGVSRL
jgi:cytochrome b